VLGLRNANALDIVTELCRLNGNSEQIATIKALLLTLSRCSFAHDVERNALTCITKGPWKLLPVREVDGSIGLRPTSDQVWFIPDKKRLKDLFTGIVPMLDFDDAGYSTMEPLLRRLDLDGRELSKHVVESTENTGALTHHALLTNSLRAKARYIAL